MRGHGLASRTLRGNRAQDKAQHSGQQAPKAPARQKLEHLQRATRAEPSATQGPTCGGGSCRVTPPNHSRQVCVGSAPRASCLQTRQLCSPFQSGDPRRRQCGTWGGVRTEGTGRSGSRLLAASAGASGLSLKPCPEGKPSHLVTPSSQLSDKRRVLRGQAASHRGWQGSVAMTTDKAPSLAGLSDPGTETALTCPPALRAAAPPEGDDHLSPDSTETVATNPPPGHDCPSSPPLGTGAHLHLINSQG